ncbi:glycoside hydrolase family 104 protein [Flavobacterium columnare]|uniref:glycoside hydrolase family 24 protein n=1 Tax=Flavobacterium columnare TaxID=996 RepID=UPI001BC899CC|nr:glycoside hydrolase family 104 protein [Flavobacterium columnare]AUX18824.1 hypothetical protein AQ623_11505 [Flavobacterium columnare]
MILKKIKDELAKNKKFAKTEDIEKALANASYDKGEKITFDTYKVPTEYLWLQAECQGDTKKHEGEFLKKDGAYFEIGKKCECEARIRAFMRMLRVGEGTENERGYTTIYSGEQFSDMSKHPEKVITAGAYSSSAAGAYQIMRYTWWWLGGEKLTDDNKKAGVYEEAHDYIKKYSIPDFTSESQDKLCVIIFKHKRPGSLELITKKQIKEALEKYGSYEWASLPPGRYGQPTQTMDVALAKYEEYLKEELAEKSNLHIKKGFLKDFDIKCNCNNQNSLETNEFGLVQVTKLGNPNIINSGTEDSYSYTKKDGTTSAVGKHGDDWMLPEKAQAFSKAVYDIVKEYPLQKIYLGDCSAYNPNKNLGHSATGAHSSGNAFDCRFLKSDGSGSNDINNLTEDEIKLNGRFIEILKSTGHFSTFYTDNGKIPGSVHSSGHADHIHGN